MSCPACGRKAPRSARFCPDCGTALAGPTKAAAVRARAALNHGRYAEALALLEQALSDHGPQAALEAWAGHALFFAGREDEAGERYRRALALDPENWEALYQGGMLAFSRDRFSEAVDALSRLQSLKPVVEGSPLEHLFGGKASRLLSAACLYLGQSLRELGRADEAVEALRRSIGLEPGDPLAYGVLGDLLRAQGRFAEAAQAYEGALPKVDDPQSLRALRNDLGVAYFAAGDLDRAADAFKAVLKEAPDDANALHNLGMLYLKRGLGEELRQDLREFLRADNAETLLMGLTQTLVEGAKRQALDLDRGGLVGEGPAMREVLELLRRAAASTATVLILGENGTGKELAARAIHLNSARKERPFVAVNCAALPETLLESELFGYEKGAFTGAVSSKPGRFELAEGGTLFLDEIGDLQPSIQVKLLRVLQEKIYERLGGTKSLHCDIRIIAATHRDLRRRVAEGSFREDLFYRLYVVPIHLPPLRERKEDLPLLANHFLARFAARQGRPVPRLHPLALKKLQSHAWPGNVRELENVLERAVAIFEGPEVLPDHLHFDAPGPAPRIPAFSAAPDPSAGLGPIERAERQALVDEMQAAENKVEDAARRLGLSRATLYRKLQRYKIKAL